MEHFEKTYRNWRVLLFRANIMIACIMILVEFFMYFIIRENGLTLPSMRRYLFRYLLIPAAANTGAILSGYLLLKRRPDSGLVNYIPPVQLAFICMVAASVHYIFSITFGIFGIPIFTTVIYSDQKLTNRVSRVCYLFLTVSLIFRRFSPPEFGMDHFFAEEAIIAFVIVFLCKKVCNVIIEFQEEKSGILARSYLSQLKMQDQLNRDQKTGLYGNTIFMNTLDCMVRSSAETGDKIALAVMDIDDFKKVNDTFGHLNGDSVIHAIAELMKQNVDSNRFTARFGGEEFAVIFTGDAADEAGLFLEKIRLEFEKLTYEFTREPITVSIGLAAWKIGWTSEELFNHADTTLYAAKDKGKNRVEVFQEVRQED